MNEKKLIWIGFDPDFFICLSELAQIRSFTEEKLILEMLVNYIHTSCNEVKEEYSGYLEDCSKLLHVLHKFENQYNFIQVKDD